MESRYRVCCVSIETLKNFSDDIAFFAQHFRLRHKELNEKLKWGMPSWNGMEYDNLDTPAAVYFIVRDRDYDLVKDPYKGYFGDVVGAARVVPTTCPTGYMLKNSFQHAVTLEELPESKAAWEGSVAVVNDRLPREERSQVFRLFAVSYLEYLTAQKAEWMYGLALKKVWDRWTQFGWPLKHLGPTVPFDDGTEGTAGKLEISEEALDRARRSASVNGRILDYGHCVQK